MLIIEKRRGKKRTRKVDLLIIFKVSLVEISSGKCVKSLTVLHVILKISFVPIYLYYVLFDNNFKFYANLLIASELSFAPHAFTESISFTETNFTDIVSFVVHYPEFYARRRAAAQ